MFSKLEFSITLKKSLSAAITVTGCLVALSLLLIPGTLRATTWSCTNSGFEIDSPDEWPGDISSSKTSVSLESPDDDELTVTIQAKKSKKRIGGNQIVSMFKKRWKTIQNEYPKSVVIQKPERTLVGEFKAISYSFRYRNFINIVVDETTIWFNAQKGDSNLKSKIEIKGPAKSTKAEGVSIGGIISSFRFIAVEEDSPPTPDVPVQTYNHIVSTPSTPSDGYGTDTTPTKRIPSDYNVATNNNTSGTLVRKTYKRRKLSKKRDFKPAGLMSNAKLITDENKLNEYQKTFQDRNTVRTAEQKAAARLYSGGFRNADVTK